jgi:ring-1,2-phenylacetyl-CoA epoxidase subunit PaaE
MALLKLEIIKREAAATDAIILYLKDVSGAPVQYEAGQFLTFILHLQERELRRSYSLASTYGVDEYPFVVIKRLANGEVSRHIIDHYKVGDQITAVAPSGRFTVSTPESAGKTVFHFAAGSGISPVFSIIKKLLHGQPECRQLLIFQNRTEASIIFRKELEALTREFPSRFKVIHLLSAPSDESKMPARLNNNMLEGLLQNEPWFSSENSLFYICGPRAFMRMCVFVLKLLHVPDEHLRQEEYVIDFFPPAPFMSDRSHKKITVNWEGARHQFVIRYPENILQGALTHHLKLPYSCRGGRCSTCIARCISGKVKMSINQVLTEKDLKEGWILTCVSYAETDVEIEY